MGHVLFIYVQRYLFVSFSIFSAYDSHIIWLFFYYLFFFYFVNPLKRKKYFEVYNKI